MNEQTKKLLEKVNEKLKDSPLFFFSRDPERALGLENILENYFVASVEENHISRSLKNVISLQTEKIELKSDSTLELVKNEKVSEWIKKNSSGKFKAQLFHFNQPAIAVLEGLGGTVLNSSADLNRKFEGKLSQLKVFTDNNIPTPKSKVVNISETNWQELSSEFGENIVVQEDRAHTGTGTYFISSETDFTDLQTKLSGNEVRIAEAISGNSYTINGCVTKKGIFVAGLQYQITGISSLTPGKGSTIGNDWSHGFRSLTPEMRKQIFEITKKIGEIMQKDGFRGLFGIDLVTKDSDFYVIEINARQTANIPMQTKLELAQNQTPLALINLAEWLEIDIDIEPSLELVPLEGAQIFLRAKSDGFEIKDNLKSGVYRLQSDYAATKKIDDDRRNEVIFIDEEQDKPLIWQRDGYCIDQINEGGFILLIQNKGQKRNKFDEVARMQFANQIVFIEGIAPWIIEAMVAIEDRVK